MLKRPDLHNRTCREPPCSATLIAAVAHPDVGTEGIVEGKRRLITRSTFSLNPMS